MFVFFFVLSFFFFFKQKTAYEMRISDWSSDVCSSDLVEVDRSGFDLQLMGAFYHRKVAELNLQLYAYYLDERDSLGFQTRNRKVWTPGMRLSREAKRGKMDFEFEGRSEEHTSELQSLMRISYAVFCLKKQTYNKT